MHAAIVHITKQNLTQENVKENMLLWKDKKKKLQILFSGETTQYIKPPCYFITH